MSDEKSEYRIKYLGIGGSDEQQRLISDHHHLAEAITLIENSGGQQLTASRMPVEEIVYECGGFVVSN